MRKSLIAANWKMNQTIAESRALVHRLLGELQGMLNTVSHVEVVICPPFTALSAVADMLQHSPVALGAQDLYWETQGAFTGEVSPAMLTDAGCRYVILGHS